MTTLATSPITIGTVVRTHKHALDLSIYLPPCLSVYLSIYLSIHHPSIIHPSIHPSVHPSINQAVLFSSACSNTRSAPKHAHTTSSCAFVHVRSTIHADGYSLTGTCTCTAHQLAAHSHLRTRACACHAPRAHVMSLADAYRSSHLSLVLHTPHAISRSRFESFIPRSRGGALSFAAYNYHELCHYGTRSS